MFNDNKRQRTIDMKNLHDAKSKRIIMAGFDIQTYNVFLLFSCLQVNFKSL